MTFTPSAVDVSIKGIGSPTAKLMLVGDFPSLAAFKKRSPIAAPVEGVLQDCLHQAGLIRSDVYITNFIPDDHMSGKYWQDAQGNSKAKPKTDLEPFQTALDLLIEEVNPNVIVTLGELPSYVLTGNAQTTKTRGYPYQYKGRIVIPSLHPEKMIWSNYIWRYYLSHDLGKAIKLANNPGLLYAPEIEIIIPDGYLHTLEVLRQLNKLEKLSIDIEVANFEVSCIGFAPSNDLAYSIPIDMRWTIEEEVRIWQGIDRIMNNPDITKIGQNFIFDIYFLAYRMCIITRGKIIDTMMSHSILYPEFLKSLNFLGSLYTNQARWKDLVTFKDIKPES